MRKCFESFRLAAGCVISLLILAISPATAADVPAGDVQLDTGGAWPTIFELNRGESVALCTAGGVTRLKLLVVEHHAEANYWTRKIRPGRPGHATQCRYSEVAP